MILSRLNNGSSVLVCLFTVYVVSKWYPSSAFSASQSPASAVRTASFSAVVEPRGSQATTMERLERLWNDPRPISQVIGNDDDLQRERKDDGDSALPYCLSTGTFEAAGCKFEVLIYPRGILDRADVGTAAAYLKFRPESPGNEADIGWTLRLVDGRTGKALPIFTSGGLPRSADTWSSAMTFTSRFEAADSVGRTADWGASTWSADDIVNSLSGPGTQLKVEGIISLYGVRDGESTFSWPLGQKGALGAIRKAAKESGSRERGQRTFRSGEVIVPTKVAAPDKIKQMEEAGIFPGVDYRVMTISDAGGNAIFSTDRLPTVEERESARLALRPVGWRLNQKKWMERGKKVTDWPVEVPANLLSTSALTRFNFETFLPRLSSLFALDAFAVLIAIAIAIAPVPLALVGRQFISFYEIPSASMDPTLQRGDLLLVEKFPGSFERTRKGDIVLFKPPPSLEEIIRSRGGNTGSANPLGGESLFVKRLVGVPGDTDIIMNSNTNEVSIAGATAIGPDRNLCGDEPLKLIDSLLASGKGKDISVLGKDELYVLGDCKTVSVDSRVFGTLPKANVAGRPVARIWPLNRFTIGAL